MYIKIFVWGNLVHNSVFLETRVVVIATKGNHRRRRKTLCMFNSLFKTWRKRLQPATHFSRLLGQNYKKATFNTFLHLVGDFLEFPLHANTTAWSKSSCACSKFSFSGTNQCCRVAFFSHQTKNQKRELGKMRQLFFSQRSVGGKINFVRFQCVSVHANEAHLRLLHWRHVYPTWRHVNFFFEYKFSLYFSSVFVFLAYIQHQHQV